MSRVPALALEGDALAPFQEDWQKIPVGGSGLGFNPSTSLRRLFFVSVQGQESYRRTLGMRKHSCQRFKTPLLLFYVFDGDSCTIKRSTRKPFLPVRDMGENGIAGLIFSQLERKGWISPCLGQCQYRYENYACRQYDTAPELSSVGMARELPWPWGSLSCQGKGKGAGRQVMLLGPALHTAARINRIQARELRIPHNGRKAVRNGVDRSCPSTRSNLLISTPSRRGVPVAETLSLGSKVSLR